ncbi:hypothetical protein [Liquorilactobacillus capillatus]|uniref:hypothetical protein n=1 Tax=Liquorilactobacillus capillatus TaxID=480931 RepID=UPI00070DD161|nr:hypothetical protein [Liquorilactobacillus capillatus]
MRLADFKLSSMDLSGSFRIFFEADGCLRPIVSIRNIHQKIIFTSTDQGTPLTLNELRKSFFELSNDYAPLFITLNDQERLIFGYRLTSTQILLS